MSVHWFAEPKAHEVNCYLNIEDLKMKTLKVIAASAILAASSSANAWWGPFDNDNGYNDGYYNGYGYGEATVVVTVTVVVMAMLTPTAMLTVISTPTSHSA